MISAIGNSFKQTISNPSLFVLSFLALAIQTLILIVSGEFFIDTIGKALELSTVSPLGGLSFVATILQAHAMTILIAVIIVSIMAGIQVSLFITLAYLIKQNSNKEPAGFGTGIKYALSQFANVFFTILFGWMIFLLGIVWAIFLFTLMDFNTWIGLAGLLLTLLILVYLQLKCLFVFSFWGIKDQHLKGGLLDSFSFVSKHWLATIGFLILSGISTSLLSLMTATIQTLSDELFLVVQVIFNALLTTILVSAIHYYALQHSKTAKSNENEPSKAAVARRLRPRKE